MSAWQAAWEVLLLAVSEETVPHVPLGTQERPWIQSVGLSPRVGWFATIGLNQNQMAYTINILLYEILWIISIKFTRNLFSSLISATSPFQNADKWQFHILQCCSHRGYQGGIGSLRLPRHQLYMGVKYPPRNYGFSRWILGKAYVQVRSG